MIDGNGDIDFYDDDDIDGDDDNTIVIVIKCPILTDVF